MVSGRQLVPDDQNWAIDGAHELMAHAVLEHRLPIGKATRADHDEICIEGLGDDGDRRCDVVDVGMNDLAVSQNSGSLQPSDRGVDQALCFSPDCGVQDAVAVAKLELPDRSEGDTSELQ